VAAGWLVATLAGAAAGGATGSIVGALTQAGVGKEEADIYAGGLRRGGAVGSAPVPDNDGPRLQALMDRAAVNIVERSAAYRRGGWKSFDPQARPETPDQNPREAEMYTREG